MDDGLSAHQPDAPGHRAGDAAGPRKPAWQGFDAAWYLDTYPEARLGMAQAGIADPERFYAERGCALGHSPNRYFDESWYLERYPDIASHVAAGGARSGFEHYVQDGLHGRSPHWLFDEAFYRRANPDLVFCADSAQGYVNGYDHFLASGDVEGRQPHLFLDPALYRRNAEPGALAAEGAFHHLLRTAYDDANRVRLSWYFDPAWYLETYPEVAELLAQGAWRCALHHYLCNRTPLRYDPQRWFSESFYGRTYPDATQGVTNGDFRNGYEHFLRFGALERRFPHRAVDLGRHLQAQAVQAALARGEHRDGFAHWVANHDDLAEHDAPMTEAQSKLLFSRMAELALPVFARRRLDFTVPGAAQGGAAELSVIVVMHDRFALTMTALASLRANFAGAIQLILVDSGSTDGCRTIERQVAGATRLRFDDNVGFVAACNAGLAAATAPCVLFMNNDLTLGTDAVRNALARLRSHPLIGAVGAKCIRTNGALQEAGSIIWRGGWTSGYLRDADPDAPEANFVRDVDFCSGAFLMVRTDLLKALGGFDPAYRPAYYEETDLCVRLAKAGYRVVYDPQVVIQHVEFGSADPQFSAGQIRRNQAIFAARHQDWLDHRPAQDQRATLLARQAPPATARVLLIEDRLPMRDLGSGFVRSNDIVRCLSRLGCQVGVYPLFPAPMRLDEALGDFPDDVELFFAHTIDLLAGFLEARAAYYDIVWIGRTHNLDRLLPIFDTVRSALPEFGLVLDTEAVATPRTVRQAQLLGLSLPHDPDAMLRRELAGAGYCRMIVAVNALDAALVRAAGHDSVAVLGHMQAKRPDPAGWEQRDGLLFVGAIHEAGSPNHDSLVWFVDSVLPLLDALLPGKVRFTIAGHVDPTVDLGPLAADPRVALLGRVEDLAPLYASHRVFVAPTRFAGGIPFKLHEAAAHGVPVVASDLLCRQVGWDDGSAILSGGDDDPARFAAQLASLHQDPALWQAIRDGALARIGAEHDPGAYQATLGAILDSVLACALRERELA